MLRVAFGVMLAFAHGLNKLRAPEVSEPRGRWRLPGAHPARLDRDLERISGRAAARARLFTRPAAALVASTLFIAAFKVHANDPFAKKELALAYAVVGLAFLLGGAGRYALDAVLKRRKG